MTKYDIRIYPEARDQLVWHAGFLRNVSEDAAERFIKSFTEAIKTLEEMPNRCPVFMEVYRRLIFEKRYMIIFRIDGETVFVEYVLDQRQDHRFIFS